MNNKSDISFASLKNSVLNAHNFIREMIYNEQYSLKVPNDNIADFVCLLIFDSIISKDTKYTYFQDISFENTGFITIKNQNNDKLLKTLQFLEDYLNYRIENPIDEGTA